MANEIRAFEDRLADRGVSRRDFLKFCGSVAAMLGMSEAMVPQIAAAVENAAGSKLYPAVWVNGGACTGCTESMAQATNPDIAQIVLDILSLNYIETIMMATGDSANQALRETVEKNEGKAIMIYEGSVMTGWDGNALRVEGKPSLEVLDEVAPKVAAIIAVGSCAVDGGWVKANPNPADATGVSQYLASKGIKTPVINLPTCPVNPGVGRRDGGRRAASRPARERRDPRGSRRAGSPEAHLRPDDPRQLPASRSLRER